MSASEPQQPLWQACRHADGGSQSVGVRLRSPQPTAEGAHLHPAAAMKTDEFTHTISRRPDIFELSRRFARMTLCRMSLVLAVPTKGCGLRKKRTGLCGSVLRADALPILTRSVRSQIEPIVGREQGSHTEADSALHGVKQAQIVQLFRKHYTKTNRRRWKWPAQGDRQADRVPLSRDRVHRPAATSKGGSRSDAGRAIRRDR